MNRTTRILTSACLSLAAASIAAQDATTPETWEGLVKVTPKHVDALALMPGSDFRPYRKLMLDPATVAFRKDWMKTVNRSGLAQRITQEDAAEIAASVRENFTESFAEAFRKAGYEIVSAPGADVLRVRAGVVDLYIAAPDSEASARMRTYTVEAGEATLFLEARDSTSGALLGRVLDQRKTRSTGRLMITNEATNLADFRALFRQWGDIIVTGLENLREISPVPADLRPGQKLTP